VQRTGYIALGRQSIILTQNGTVVTILPAVPLSGSGTAAQIAFTFNDYSSSGYGHLQSVNIDLAGQPGCHIYTFSTGDCIALLNDSGPSYQSLTLPTHLSVSNSNCTLLGNGTSISASGGLLMVSLHLNFSTAFSGIHTIQAKASGSGGTNYAPFPVGSWTVPATTTTAAPYNVGYFQPNGPQWVLDSNGSGGYDVADRVFAFAGQPGAIAVVGDWNDDGKSKVG